MYIVQYVPVLAAIMRLLLSNIVYLFIQMVFPICYRLLMAFDYLMDLYQCDAMVIGHWNTHRAQMFSDLFHTV